MISKADMKSHALLAQIEGLEQAATFLKLPMLGPDAKQRDVNKLRAYLLAEAGKLRAKELGVKDADKNKKLKRLLGEGNERTEVPPQGMQE